MSHMDLKNQKKPSNAGLKSPSPYQLRALVLDYLSHQCYGATARAFLRESTVKELDADGVEILGGGSVDGGADGLDSSSPSSVEMRLKQIDQRREIRERILAGEVDDAIDLLNLYFPSVLSGSPSDVSLITARTALDPSGSYTYVSPTSVEPSHLLLNLRILAFTECCRTEPIVIPTSHTSPLSSSSDEAAGDGEHGPDDSCFPSSSSGSYSYDPNEGEEGDPTKQDLLIQKAIKLNELVKALPSPKDREIYGKELTNVASLLAYKRPEKSDVAKYLSWERRVAVADQVNRAILQRCGLAPISNIELAARYTTVLWESARAHGVKPRAGIPLPPRPAVLAPPTTTKTDKGDKKGPEGEQLPTFDLKDFVRGQRS